MIIWAWVAAYSSQFERLSLELSTTHPQLFFHPWLVDSGDTSLCLTQVILSLLPQRLWWLQCDSFLPVSCTGTLGPRLVPPFGQTVGTVALLEEAEGALYKFKHQCLPSSLCSLLMGRAHHLHPSPAPAPTACCQASLP